MTALPSEFRAYATRRLLIWRVRVIMLICAAGSMVFGCVDLLTVHHASRQFWVQVLGSALAMVSYWALGQRWVVRRAWPISVVTVSVAYVLTAMLSPIGDPWTPAVLFVGAAMTTATILPWGVGAQLATVGVGAASLACAVFVADGTLHGLLTNPGAATAIGLMWSIVIVREVNRYRVGQRRELLMRRRQEHAIRRLNARLEQRVAERTAELHRANETLARESAERLESQRRLADTVDHSNAIISLKDPGGRYVLVNREFEAVFGLPRARVLGRSDRELFTPEMAQRLSARDETVLETGAAVPFEEELSIGDAVRSYVFVKFPLHGADNAPYGVGTVATDISRVKQLQEELRSHQGELAHVLRLHTITEMAAGLAHEINQPLCAITNYAQGGVQRLRAGSAIPHEILGVFERIAEEGLRAGQIIRGIRNLVQGASSPTQPIDVNALAAEAVRLIEWRARQQGVTVRLERADGLPLVWADAAQVEQVILNLMLNGVEAIDGAASERREVVVATGVSDDGVEVAVSDSGVGLSPSAAEKLFTPFFTTKSAGLGLGLAISRSIVELHGGRLWAMRNPTAGMTFCFWLPVRPPDRVPLPGIGGEVGAARRLPA